VQDPDCLLDGTGNNCRNGKFLIVKIKARASEPDEIEIRLLLNKMIELGYSRVTPHVNASLA